MHAPEGFDLVRLPSRIIHASLVDVALLSLLPRFQNAGLLQASQQCGKVPPVHGMTSSQRQQLCGPGAALRHVTRYATAEPLCYQVAWQQRVLGHY